MNNLLNLTDDQIKELLMILIGDDADFYDIINKGTYNRKNVDGEDIELVIEYYDKIKVEKEEIRYVHSPMPVEFEIFSLDEMNKYLKINEYFNA